jgi:hypothetical protein
LAGVLTGPLGVYLLNLYRTRPRLRAWQIREFFHFDPGYASGVPVASAVDAVKASIAAEARGNR